MLSVCIYLLIQTNGVTKTWSQKQQLAVCMMFSHTRHLYHPSALSNPTSVFSFCLHSATRWLSTSPQNWARQMSQRTNFTVHCVCGPIKYLYLYEKNKKLDRMKDFRCVLISRMWGFFLSVRYLMLFYLVKENRDIFAIIYSCIMLLYIFVYHLFICNLFHE